MPRTSYRWWGFIKAVVRDYPTKKKRAEHETLKGADAREFEAVKQAIEETQSRQDGEERMELVRLVFWNPNMTLHGAAMRRYISYGTAKLWCGDFLHLVAYHMGLME